MELFRFERKQHLNIGLEEAWQFFSNPVNLAAITPPWLGFTIDSKLPLAIYPGLIIKYKVSPLLGIKMNWVTEITHVNEPYYFVDEQRFGPYKFWHHQHHFKSSVSGTEVEDIVSYGMPAAASLVNKYIVAEKLKKIFDYRSEILNTRFKST